MDLVHYDENTFNTIVKDFKGFASKLNVKDVRFIPISALKGDNIVYKSNNLNWYEGGTLLYELENIHISGDQNHIDCRFPIQTVIRPHRQEFQDFRGYAGRIESGVFRQGDSIQTLPSGFKSTIDKIFLGEENIDEAFAPMSVTITLKDELDISRGDMIIRENNSPQIVRDIEVLLTWMSETKLSPNTKLLIKHTTQELKCIISNIVYEIDINTLHRKETVTSLGINSIGRVSIKLAKSLFVDRYDRNRNNGCIILIDPNTAETVGAGIVL